VPLLVQILCCDYVALKMEGIKAFTNIAYGTENHVKIITKDSIFCLINILQVSFLIYLLKLNLFVSIGTIFF
jgi:hypothetical protein